MSIKAVDDDARIKIVTIICLTVIVCVALAGITLAALFTDRNLHYAEGLSAGGVLVIALLGGLTWNRLLRRHRWRLERTEESDESTGRDEAPTRDE